MARNPRETVGFFLCSGNQKSTIVDDAENQDRIRYTLMESDLGLSVIM